MHNLLAEAIIDHWGYADVDFQRQTPSGSWLELEPSDNCQLDQVPTAESVAARNAHRHPAGTVVRVLATIPWQLAEELNLGEVVLSEDVATVNGAHA